MKTDSWEVGAGIHVLTVTGEVDMSTSPKLRNALLPLFKSGTTRIVVDFGGVSYTDSSGIATLVEGLQLSRKENVRFVLAGVRPEVRAVFELAYLDSVFEMVADLDAALSEDAE